MAKKSWLNVVRSFFIREKKSKQQNKEKRRRWFFGRLTVKRLPSISAAPLSSSNHVTVNEAEEEQSKHALTVAIATAAAAQACVAAAQVATEVARLTSISEPIRGCKEKEQEIPQIISKTDSIYHCQKEKSASIKIQAAFRGYLARKALRALKGIVKLQALIRGRLVRHQAASTLKSLQSIVSIQSQVFAMRLQMSDQKKCKYGDIEDKLSLTGNITREDSKGERRWDHCIMSKEATDVSYISKKEAMLKRERIKEYAFRHRKSAETERSNVNGRWRYWLEQWVDTQLSTSKEFEDLDSVVRSNSKLKEEDGGRQLRLKAIRRRQCPNEETASPTCTSRKSKYERKQGPSLQVDENSLSSPPGVPTYMAATESAKAKARPTNSPKLRTLSFDTCSESYSPYKNNMCLVSSVNSDGVVVGGMIKHTAYHQRSPSMKGLPIGPVKSSRMRKDLSFDSDSSLPNWDRDN